MPSFDLRSLPGLVLFQDEPSQRPGSLHANPGTPDRPAWYVLTFPELPDSWMGPLLREASPERAARAQRFRKPIDALRCLAAEALLRFGLWDRHGLEPGDFQLQADPMGKPFLAQQPSIHVSLSHSGPWVLAAIHSRPVGVDVEEIRPLGILPLDTILSPEEAREFLGLDPASRCQAFYRTWTLKESLLKAAGKGFSLDPRGITLRLEGDGWQAAGGPAPTPGHRWGFNCLDLDPSAKAALCWCSKLETTSGAGGAR